MEKNEQVCQRGKEEYKRGKRGKRKLKKKNEGEPDVRRLIYNVRNEGKQQKKSVWLKD